MSHYEIVVPEGMRRAVGNVPVFSGVSGEQTTEIIDGILNSVLRWQIENWGTAPNSQRMPDIWYAKSKAKWETFKSQWESSSQISFVDLLIFFVTRYHESFLAQEPEYKDGTVIWKEGTTIPLGVWSGGKMYTTNIPTLDTQADNSCPACDHGQSLERGEGTHREGTRQHPVEPQEESVYWRVVNAMGAVTLSRKDGDRILEYVRGAIHG